MSLSLATTRQGWLDAEIACGDIGYIDSVQAEKMEALVAQGYIYT